MALRASLRAQKLLPQSITFRSFTRFFQELKLRERTPSYRRSVELAAVVRVDLIELDLVADDTVAVILRLLARPVQGLAGIVLVVAGLRQPGYRGQSVRKVKQDAAEYRGPLAGRAGLICH